MEVKIIVIYSFYALRLSFLRMILRIRPYEKSDRRKQNMIASSSNCNVIKDNQCISFARYFTKTRSIYKINDFQIILIVSEDIICQITS
jgi:hypothetical protein